MYYGNLKNCDIADGTGVRVTLFVSGCRNHCKGCFQPETWDFGFGNPFTPDTEDEIMELLKPDYIKGLTVLGGEPFEEENQAILAGFLEKIKEAYPDKDIWCYTGYVYDKDLVPGGRKYTEYTDRMLACIDTLVDGPFIEELKDLSLEFRGSSNQRIIRFNHNDAENLITASEPVFFNELTDYYGVPVEELEKKTYSELKDMKDKMLAGKEKTNDK